MKKKSIEEIENELKEEKISCEKVKLDISPIDMILNGGILNKSDVIQLVGETMTYKTAFALEISKSYCRQEKHVLYIDASGSITNERLESYGLLSSSKKYFHFYKKACFDDVCCILDKYISTNEVSLIVIDSIADLMNKGYFNLEMNAKGKTNGIEVDNKNSNYDSKPLSLFLKKYSKLATSIGYSMILVNQMRTKMIKKIGTVEKRHGPKVLDYCCTYILQLLECKNNEFYDGLNTIEEVKPFYIKVIKSSNNLTGKKYPTLMAAGKCFSMKYLIINHWLKSNMIEKTGTYYELKGANIKENGLSNLLKKIPEEVFERKECIKEAKNEIEEYYKSL